MMREGKGEGGAGCQQRADKCVECVGEGTAVNRVKVMLDCLPPASVWAACNEWSFALVVTVVALPVAVVVVALLLRQ